MEADRQLALQLLLDDINELESNQGTRTNTGVQNDFRVAMAHMKRFIEEAWAPPRTQGNSIIDFDDDLTDFDVDYDLIMRSSELNPSSEDASGTSASIGSSVEESEEETEQPSDVCSNGYETEHEPLSDEQLASPARRSARIAEKQAKELAKVEVAKRTCAACLDPDESTLATHSCGHYYCHKCFKEILIGAMKDEERYPPRCCGRNIPIGVSGPIVLSQQEYRDYKARSIEWDTKDRLYCADPKCAQFIPPSNIKSETGFCKRCKKETHVICRLLSHQKGIDCPKDTALQEVISLAKSNKWQRCTECGAMVERWGGCHHMSCRSVY